MLLFLTAHRETFDMRLNLDEGKNCIRSASKTSVFLHNIYYVKKAYYVKIIVLCFETIGLEDASKMCHKDPNNLEITLT